MNTEHLSVLLQKLNIDFRLIKNTNAEVIIQFLFLYQKGNYRCTLEIAKQEIGMVLFNFEFPSAVPRLYLSNMTEMVALLNNQLQIGCWEIDPKPGSVRFRISYLAETESFSTELILIENLLCGSEIMKAAYPGLLSVIVDGCSATDAFLAMNRMTDYKLN
jgi:hypothetical protein